MFPFKFLKLGCSGLFVASFGLLDRTTKRIHGEDKSHLTVIAFTSTSCPLSKKYLPTLVDIHSDFKARGVRFVLVNCVATDRQDEMKAALERFTSNVEYTFDKDLKLANHLGATSTTDVFVLDQSYTVIYHGAIDDQYGFGYSIDTPRCTCLRDALEASLEHRPVLVSATAAPGCLLETRQTATASSEITYHNQISRLLQRHCVECHRKGGVHHVLVFVQGAGEEDGTRDDAADERSGYWGIYVPGNSTLVYPEGYAKRIPKGARLRFQM